MRPLEYGRTPAVVVRTWRAFLLLFTLALPARSGAQQPAEDPLREAMRLRDAGDLPGAITLLRARLADAPTDGTVLRLLAQTLYWGKERTVAGELYERGMTLHPEDLQLRVDFGRMLVETGDAARARTILEPLLETAHASQAQTLLGTSAYWNGDWNGAVRHFRLAIAADPSAQRARELWREIAAISAPWMRAGVDVGRDNQPLRTFGPLLEAGAHVTPLWSMGIRVRGSGTSSPGIASSTWQHLEAFTTATFVPLRLRVEGDGGPVRREGSTELMGHVAARVMLAGLVSLGARVGRQPYTHTIASIRTPVRVDERTALLFLDGAGGWLGEAAITRQQLPDANTIDARHAWVLAPLVNRAAGTFRVGYSVSREHARELRFVLSEPVQDVPPADPGFKLAGRYAPYYTPDHLVAHSALAAITLRAGAGTSFFIDGAYAVHATDQAPYWFVAGSPPAPVRGSFERSLHPARTSARWEQRLGPDITLEVNAAYLRTIYYASRRIGMSVMWRGASAAMRRVDNR